MKPINLESMLRSAFLKAELDYLNTLPAFTEAKSALTTAGQFERLCEVGQSLLTAQRG